MNLGNYRISAKILAVITVLGLVAAAITGGGVAALSALNQAAVELERAGDISVLGARMRQNVLALSRAEFRIAADPTGANLTEAKSIIETQRKQLTERLVEGVALADEQQAQLLSEINNKFDAYMARLEDTVATADRNSSQVDITGAQHEVVEQAMKSREAAAVFEEDMRAFLEHPLKMAADLSDHATQTYERASLLMIAGAVIGIVLGLGAGYLVSQRGIVGPIRRIVECLQALAGGDLEVTVFGTERKDEVGEIGRTTQVFKENMIRTRELEAEQVEAEKRAVAEKKRLMNELADSFQSSVGGIVETVSSSASEMQVTAQSLTSTAEETSRQSTAVAAASEQASTNVQTVASAAEELSSSITEISRQVGQSAQIAGKAVTDAERTNVQVQGLAEAAQKIGEVVNLITDIASQTNLLALNATIEAARAGDAGKGFAVVASEVKNLANETAKATEEITGQITSIQAATREAVSAIQSIGQTIGQINEIATTIASAVEEQGAATQEIARNVQQASAGTTEVSSNITGVTQAAGETGAAASQMLSASGELARQGEHLRGEVDKFLQAVRAA